MCFIGTRRGMEAKLIPAENFPIEWIEIGGLKRVGFLRDAETLAELPWSVWQASRMLDRASPLQSSRRGLCGWTCPSGGPVEAHSGGRDGAERDPRLHASPLGAVRRAGTGRVSRRRRAGFQRVAGGYGAAGAAKNFSRSR